MNVTYVGLAWNTLDYGAGYWVLIFADQLSQPISVQAGDVVTVVYKIVVP